MFLFGGTIEGATSLEGLELIFVLVYKWADWLAELTGTAVGYPPAVLFFVKDDVKKLVILRFPGGGIVLISNCSFELLLSDPNRGRLLIYNC